MRRTIVGVMGGSACDERTRQNAYELGRLIAGRGWVLLNGGRPTGVMDASARGCRDGGGLSVGVLFDSDADQASEAIDIVLPTGMGAGRNIINVLASDVVVACCGSGGTLSEVALAIRFERPTVLLDFDPGEAFLRACGSGPWRLAATPEEAVAAIAGFLAEKGRGARP
jgi:uncharacterized protein (TIGR00725 family)